MKAPATLDEFYRTFPTERRCWEVLRRVRWPDGFRCPRCEGRKAHRLRVRGLWQCASCRYQASLTAGKVSAPLLDSEREDLLRLSA